MIEIANNQKLVVPQRRRRNKASALAELREWQFELRRLEKNQNQGQATTPVFIPYVDQLSLPVTYIITRRAFWVVLELIKHIARLRHWASVKLAVRCEPVVEESAIEANMDDYKKAYEIIQPVLKVIYTPWKNIGLPTPDELSDTLNPAEESSNE